MQSSYSSVACGAWASLTHAQVRVAGLHSHRGAAHAEGAVSDGLNVFFGNR